MYVIRSKYFKNHNDFVQIGIIFIIIVVCRWWHFLFGSGLFCNSQGTVRVQGSGCRNAGQSSNESQINKGSESILYFIISRSKILMSYLIFSHPWCCFTYRAVDNNVTANYFPKLFLFRVLHSVSEGDFLKFHFKIEDLL